MKYVIAQENRMLNFEKSQQLGLRGYLLTNDK